LLRRKYYWNLFLYFTLQFFKSALEWGEFEAIKDYFEDTYIGRIKAVPQKVRPGMPKLTPKLVRSKPLFEPTLWNHYRRTLLGQARTNNSVEGWHGAMARALGQDHPNMWKLIKQFQVEALKTLTTAEQISVGNFKKNFHQTYVINNKAIKTLVTQFNTFDDNLEYLQKLSRHIATFASI